VWVLYLEIAIGIQEQVAWFKIAMQHIRRVHALEGTKGLIDKVLTMIVTQILGPDHSMHVGLHQLLNQIAAGRNGWFAVSF
jgi:hypothetical protein